MRSSVACALGPIPEITDTGSGARKAAVRSAGTMSMPSGFARAEAIFATARPHERGAASAMASACLDLGLGFGPILLGAVAQASGISAAMLAAAGVGLAGAGWIWSLQTVRTPRPA